MDLLQTCTFTAHVEELMEEFKTPGLAIALVHNDKVASAAYGHASLNPPTPCTPDTLFDIGSASKSLTAASVALLVHDDESYPKVKYETVVSSLLPDDFVISGKEYTESITVEDMLCHRTGMPGHDSSPLGVRAAKPDTAQSVTRNLRNLAVVAPVRSKYIYCNAMYTVASYLVEKQSKLSFSDFLAQNFFQPLGMTSTSLQPEQARAEGLGDRIATGHAWDEEKEQYLGFPSPDCPEGQGAGSIVSSVNDYIKWVKAMINQESPISAEIYEGLLRSRSIPEPDFGKTALFTSLTTCAAGWDISFYRGYAVVRHDGSVPGFNTCHFFIPDFKFGGVIFGNSSDAEAVVVILFRELVDEVLGVPLLERPEWRKIEADNKSEDDEDDLRESICPGLEEAQIQTTSLDFYTGRYHNIGYHYLAVEIKDEKLFINANDRSMGFTLSFEHICDQTKFIAHLRDFLEGGDIPLRAEFEFKNDKAVRMGLHLEPELGDLIWFDRDD